MQRTLAGVGALSLVWMLLSCASGPPRPATGTEPRAERSPPGAVLTPASAQARFCDEGRHLVFSFSDANGKIGGYRVSSKVRDSPITYFDDRGEALGNFHIYGEPQTKERRADAIEQLRRDFPVERRIACDAPPTPSRREPDP